MRNLLFIILLSLLATAQVRATDNTAILWQKANGFYAEKQYDSAQCYYEQLAASKPQNAPLYYNLGNTYYRLNNVPQAVLCYQRALAIMPEYKQARENLLLTQSRISNNIPQEREIFFIRWWHAATRADRANGLAVTALLLFALYILLLLVNKVKKGVKAVPPQVNGFVLFAFFCVLALAAVSAKNATGHDKAVVMLADAPLMGNELKGKPLLFVPAGTTVSIKDQKGDWIAVSLPDGHSGWLQAAIIEKI